MKRLKMIEDILEATVEILKLEKVEFCGLRGKILSTECMRVIIYFTFALKIQIHKSYDTGVGTDLFEAAPAQGRYKVCCNDLHISGTFFLKFIYSHRIRNLCRNHVAIQMCHIIKAYTLLIINKNGGFAIVITNYNLFIYFFRHSIHVTN